MASRWVERLLAAHEPPLTPAQYLALEAVAKGEVVGAELARQAAVSPAAASQLLGSLEADGLVERLKAPDDRRRQPLALTTEGDDVLRSARALLSERLAALLGELPGPEAEALARLLQRVESLLTGTAPPRRPPRPPHRPPKRRH
jgi:MarR family transcriptional regulator, organic hydroperoxide resistance regulator